MAADSRCLSCASNAALADLPPRERVYVGPGWLAAMRAVLGCSKTYVALFAEAEGFEHVHFHVVPRSLNLDPALRGPRVFGHLGGDPARHVPAQVMDQLAVRIGQALRLDS